MNGGEPAAERRRPVADSNADPALPEPDGPVDPTVSASPIEEVLDPWQPRHEMIGRRLVPPDQVLDALSWQRKEIAHRLLHLALDADQYDRTR